jgi:hypothetical protein
MGTSCSEAVRAFRARGRLSDAHTPQQNVAWPNRAVHELCSSQFITAKPFQTATMPPKYVKGRKKKDAGAKKPAADGTEPGELGNDAWHDAVPGTRAVLPRRPQGARSRTLHVSSSGCRCPPLRLPTTTHGPYSCHRACAAQAIRLADAAPPNLIPMRSAHSPLPSDVLSSPHPLACRGGGRH